jgi:hypothetical protein
MVSASGGVETVLFGSQLQYWNNTAWVNLSTDAYGVNGWSGWFQGLSNSYGRLDQQLYKSLLPYQTWFLTMTGNVPNDFNGVVWHVWSGYYFRTVEYYSWPAKSTSWYSKPSSVGPYASSVVGSSYCLAP